jgi:type IV pilus assembly protein PilY1
MNVIPLNSIVAAFALLGVGLLSVNASGQSSLSQAPMTVQQPAAPIVMLSVGRDERLYYPVYNNYSDIDGDGTIDVDYKPGVITYFGLFDSNKCYTYSSANSRFEPSKSVTDVVKKTCGQSVAWSGDWLNYVTTSRMDALRRVFYGGKRIETATTTVLERAYIPQDAHAWGGEFNATRSSYDIRQYTPLSSPATNTQHLFANVTKNGSVSNPPLIRVLLDRPERVFNWIAKEGPVGDTTIDPAQDANGNQIANTGGSVSPTDYVVRVQVCVVSTVFPLESDCKGYPSASPTVWRPTGVLHDYGESKAVAFGLITGSYDNARAGGVLRKNISYFNDEIDATTGMFLTTINGIVSTFDKLRISQWQTGGYDCSGSGGCKDYGNPIAEIMYEGLRYLGSGVAGTPSYAVGTSGTDSALGLPLPSWLDPYRATTSGGFPVCSKPTQMVVSDVNPTFDSDDLPGSSFSSLSSFSKPALPSKLSGLDVTSLGQSIWTAEGLGSKTYFIGESKANIGNTYDAAPSPKLANSFGTIRGLAPSDPTRQGSYYAAAVANFGAKNAITTPGNKPVDTYAIALAPSIPSIAIPTGSGTITIAPFGKSTGGCNYGEFVSGATFLTNRIVGFYFDSVENVPGFPTTASNGGRPIGSFRVSFEDNEQGTDNDMDAIVRYSFQVNADKTLTIRLRSDYAAGCIDQNMGFVIAGSTSDGAILGVKDKGGNGSAYALNDSANSYDLSETGARIPATGGKLGLYYERTFTASNSATAGGAIPQNPLWYAAKYGSTGAVPDTTTAPPPNYAFVNNPARLRAQIAAALDNILTNSQPSTAVGVSGGVVRTDTSLAFSSNFLYSNQSVTRWSGASLSATLWKGGIDAIRLNDDGTLGNTVWTASFPIVTTATNPGDDFPVAKAGRTVITRIGTLGWVALNKSSLATDAILTGLLAPTSMQTRLKDKLIEQFGATAMADAAQLKQRTAEAVANYIKGDPSLEIGNSPATSVAGPLRIRDTPLGDIVNSVPVYDGAADYGHGSTSMPGASTYAAYVKNTKSSRTKRVWVGANDGMLHAFDGSNSPTGGKILWSFIPKALQPKLVNLAAPSYSHEYFMDGKVTIGDVYDGANWKTILVASSGAGARTVVAVDITGATPQVLWEVSAGAPGADFDDLGYVLGRLSITRVNKGSNGTQWAVVFGNGYESSVQNGTTTKQVGRLFVLDALTGAQLGNKLTIPATTGVSYNGLASPAIVREETTAPSTGTSRASVTAWAGDLAGNLWRFRMDGDPTAWQVESYSATGTTPKPLFTAARSEGGVVTPQPITAEPTVINSLSLGYYVSFGTGKFFQDADRSSTAVQSLYSVRDLATTYQINNASSTFLNGTSGLKRSNLRKFSIATQTGTPGDTGARTLSAEALTDAQRGWYVDFDQNGVVGTPAERVLAPPIIFLPFVYAGTFQPTKDSCSSGSSGWLMAAGVDKAGGVTTSFDTNGDGTYETTGANGARTSSGFSGGFGLVASSDGTRLNFVGLPGAYRKLAQGGGDKRSPAAGAAKRPNTGLGRTGWRQIQ